MEASLYYMQPGQKVAHSIDKNCWLYNHFFVGSFSPSTDNQVQGLPHSAQSTHAQFATMWQNSETPLQQVVISTQNIELEDVSIER